MIFPVLECRLRYRAAARYDDKLMIELWPTRVEGVRLNFGFRILNQAGVLILEGETLHACTGLNEKPKRLPEELRVWLGWHNGQQEDLIGCFIDDWILMSSEEIAEEWTQRQKDAEGAAWEGGWIPLLDDGQGGLVCLEIARRLREAGETVALLTVLDAYPSRSLLSLSQRLQLFLRMTSKRLGAAIGISPEEKKSSTSEELRAQMSAGRPGVKLTQSAATASMTPSRTALGCTARASITRGSPAWG